MTRQASILIVDDEVTNIEVLSSILEDEHETYFATSGPDAIEIARSSKPDLILLDVLMPGMDGYEVCRRIKAEPVTADIPVMFTTALGDHTAETKGLELGAIDYITKPITPIVVQARVRNHLELKWARDKLAKLAVTDALTGLGNRRFLKESLDREISRLSRTQAPLSVMMLDIDFFKRFNDTYGHLAGDRCIATVATVLNAAMRVSGDFAARYGGEEFACVLPTAGHDVAMAMAHDIRSRIEALGIPHQSSEVASCVTVSVGVVTALCDADAEADCWIKAADAQLYRAKLAGRNEVFGCVPADLAAEVALSPQPPEAQPSLVLPAHFAARRRPLVEADPTFQIIRWPIIPKSRERPPRVAKSSAPIRRLR